jgi:hypothetical protein
MAYKRGRAARIKNLVANPQTIRQLFGLTAAFAAVITAVLAMVILWATRINTDFPGYTVGSTGQGTVAALAVLVAGTWWAHGYLLKRNGRHKMYGLRSLSLLLAGLAGVAFWLTVRLPQLPFGRYTESASAVVLGAGAYVTACVLLYGIVPRGIGSADQLKKLAAACGACGLAVLISAGAYGFGQARAESSARPYFAGGVFLPYGADNAVDVGVPDRTAVPQLWFAIQHPFRTEGHIITVEVPSDAQLRQLLDVQGDCDIGAAFNYVKTGRIKAAGAPASACKYVANARDGTIIWGDSAYDSDSRFYQLYAQKGKNILLMNIDRYDWDKSDVIKAAVDALQKGRAAGPADVDDLLAGL